METNDKKLKAILLEIYEKLKDLDGGALDGHYLNERYLHHYFSHQVQVSNAYSLDYGNRAQSTFHPEWTTKGKYREGKPNKDGTTGNIDFVLGKYDKLEYGIEFKHSQGWNVKALRFDYVKLLDKCNEIGRAISLAVIFRKTELSVSELHKAIDRLKTELGNRLAHDRQFLFVIVQVVPGGKSDNIRSWYCNNLAKGFERMTEIWFEAE